MNNNWTFTLFILAFFSLGCVSVPPAFAIGQQEEKTENQHKRQGSQKKIGSHTRSRKILPYAKILEKVRFLIEGEIIKTEFEYQKGRPVYEIKYITPNGVVLEIYINARSGRVFKKEQY